MIGHLKDVFLDRLMIAMSAMITLIILEFVHKSLKLTLLTWLYWELLDRLNITYPVNKITKLKYEVLGFLIPQRDRVGTILKTIIFIDNVKDAWCITVYLCLKLWARLQNKG